MDKISIEKAVKAVGGKLISGSGENFIEGVKHDSRECFAGDLFVAIKGENHDGHKYIPQVVNNGCQAVLVSHKEGWYDEVKDENLCIIMVEDTVYALGELAKYYLNTLDVKKVAITGSVGKTSVRDMIYYVLSEKYNCGRNLKNFNNNIGLPISIFQFDSSTEVVVLEMGMNHFDEIDRLAEIVKPNIGVITNIGISHIENLGSREGIFRAKMEMAGHIVGEKGKKGVLVFVDDEEFLTKENTKGDYSQVSIGKNGRSDYIISDIDDFGLDGIQFFLEHLEKCRKINIPVAGRHNAVNGALALAVGNLLGVSDEEGERGLGNVNLTGSRLKALDDGKVRIIDDTYNASPDSMKSALRVLENSRTQARRIAVLGDMYELGEESESQHLGVGIFARSLNIDTVIAIGKSAEKIYEGVYGGEQITAYYEKKEDFYKDIDDFIGEGDIILVKGSRGMEMERIVEKILES